MVHRPSFLLLEHTHAHTSAGVPAAPPLQYTEAAVMAAVKEVQDGLTTYHVSASFKLKSGPARRAFMRVRRALAAGEGAIAASIGVFRTTRRR